MASMNPIFEVLLLSHSFIILQLAWNSEFSLNLMNRNCPIMKHLSPLPMKSKGRVKRRQKKKNISNLAFPQQIHHLLYLIISPQRLIDREGIFSLRNYSMPQKKKRTIGAQQRQLTNPIAPKEIQRTFCPWLFISTLPRYYLLRWGVLVTRISPMTEARSASTRVREKLKGLMMMNATLRTVSMGQKMLTSLLGGAG